MSTNEELASMYQHGDQAALLKLWDQVRGLVYTIARSYQEMLGMNAAVDLDDLLQASFLAVEAAARSFDADRAKFSTYVVMHVRTQCRAALGMVGRPRLEHYNARSLDAPLSEESESTLHDLTADPSAEPIDAQLEEDDLVQHVRLCVSELPQRQAEAVARHWLEGETYEALSAAMGLPPLSIRRLCKKGLKQLSRRRDMRELAEAHCWRHVSLSTYRTTHTSSTEQAALWRMKRAGL